ncbi:TPA: phosphate transport system regulatory protein PhoU, partial [candidate division WOR-3 bacterium]|nr:phosphate transport system regulatory protein PhoU [candidate division WOR-3 bacterium]
MISERINQLNNEIIDFASIAESMIDKSIKGLVERDKNLLEEVMNVDEEKANKFETKMDELLFQFIAQFEPKAKDLRRVLMMLQMSNDLERIGDHAVNICESASMLVELPQIKNFNDLPRMAEIVIGMLKDSIDAFIKADSALAESVCERDNIVDDLRRSIAAELLEIMSRDSKTIERAMHINRIAANLERIADLSTNISEDVIFIEKGKVIKHHL